MSWSLSNINENLATQQDPEQEIAGVIELGNGNQENKKRRKRESKVWEEMTKVKREDGSAGAKCNHCEKVFDGSSNKGTTHLKNHLDRCRQKRKGGEDAQESMKTSDLTSSDVIKETSVIELIKNCFDEEGHETEHWYPSVLNSRKADILKVYQEEKEKLRKSFSQLSCRFSLKIERLYHWVLLIAHYIDENWEPRSKIIRVQKSTNNFKSLIAIPKDLCLDWTIDGRKCSAVTNYDENGYEDAGYITDAAVTGEINSWFTQRDSLPFCGFLPSINGALSWFGFICSHVNGLRECIAYVNKTPSNQQKFATAVNDVKSMGKKLPSKPLPTGARLGSEEIEIAFGCKEAFCELERIDPDFKTRNLTNEQWDEVIALSELQESVDNIRSLYDTSSTTTNMYFSKFCDLHVKLLLPYGSYYSGKNTSPVIEKLASWRQEFIDKYWSKYNLVLVITVILDPRFKMDIVQLWYNKIYGCDADRCLEKIINDFKHIYNEYAKGRETSSLSYLDSMGRPCASSNNVISSKLELDQYLNEPKFSPVKEFDILAWWRLYSPIFPTLARMARDYLGLLQKYEGVPDDCAIKCYFIISTKKFDDELQSALLHLLCEKML